MKSFLLFFVSFVCVKNLSIFHVSVRFSSGFQSSEGFQCTTWRNDLLVPSFSPPPAPTLFPSLLYSFLPPTSVVNYSSRAFVPCAIRSKFSPLLVAVRGSMWKFHSTCEWRFWEREKIAAVAMFVNSQKEKNTSTRSLTKLCRVETVARWPIALVVTFSLFLWHSSFVASHMWHVVVELALFSCNCQMEVYPMSALGASCHQAETHRTGLGWAVSLSRVGCIG